MKKSPKPRLIKGTLIVREKETLFFPDSAQRRGAWPESAADLRVHHESGQVESRFTVIPETFSREERADLLRQIAWLRRNSDLRGADLKVQDALADLYYIRHREEVEALRQYALHFHAREELRADRPVDLGAPTYGIAQVTNEKAPPPKKGR